MKKFLALILTLALLMGLGAVAYADDGTKPNEYRTDVGEYASWSLNEREGYSVNEILTVDGSLPGGMFTQIDGMGRLIISGTPNTAGTYKVNFSLDVTDGTNTWGTGLSCIFYIDDGDVTLPTFETTVSAGKDTKIVMDMSGHGTISGIKPTIGEIPDGMYGDFDSSAAYLIGKPTKAGTYKFTVAATLEGSDVRLLLPCVVTVKGNAAPAVTKHPTGETITENGHTAFIARADNANKITWRFVSKDGGTVIKAADAPSYFSGLKINGTDEEQLNVDKVPLSMSGWSAQAVFEGDGGTATSDKALLTVKRAELKAPVLTAQPKGAQLKAGESVTLSVTATSPDNNKLNYQWYKNNKNSASGGELIPGATGASLNVGYVEGSVFYYCTVTNSRDSEVSPAVSSDAAEVVGIKAAEPTPAPTPAPTPTPAPAPTSAPAEPYEAPRQAEKADHTVAFIVGIVLCVALICGTLIFIQHKEAQQKPDKYQEQIRRVEEYRGRHRK